MENIFSIKSEDLDRLSDKEAVVIFRDLLHAKARTLNIPSTSINVSGDIYVADGGVDASVQNSPVESDLIKKGQTSYQIKTGSAFNPLVTSKLRNELVETKRDKPRKLKIQIKNCLEADGTYVLVCFGREFTNVQKNTAESNIKSVFTEFGHPDAKNEVWGQNQLQAFFSPFPSLALRLNGRSDLNFHSHHTWSDFAMMRPEFESGEKQQQFVADLRNELRANQEFVHIRVKGEPGIGKTRSVLEATKSVDLASSVIYCNADLFQNSQLMHEVLKPDNTFSAILVLDDCDEDRRFYIWDKLKFKSHRIKLITITNEYVRRSSDVGDFDVPLLEPAQISSIIRRYNVQQSLADLWSAECEGFARVAHEVGKSLRDYPDDPNKSPDMDQLWDRFISGLDNPKSTEVKQRKIVLRHLSLFRKFGSPLSKSGIPVISDEANAVSDLIQEKTNINQAEFKELIKTLKERKILQGENTLYITPKLLHIKLWADYWEIYGAIDDVENFAERLPPKLFGWFRDMFKYARTSPAAEQIVKKLLGNDGIYRHVSFLRTDAGADFFLTLSKAAPKSALVCLKRIIDGQSKNDLESFNTGRRQVVWALERMAEWKDLFPAAARILLRLGEAENESYSNNASGIFINLFSNAIDLLAPSEATPAEKIPVLREALTSESKEQHLLALAACDNALKTEHFSRSNGTFDEPFQPSPNRWKPKTYDEWFDAYRKIWELILDVIGGLPQDGQQMAANILLRNAFAFGKTPALAELAINTIRGLLDRQLRTKNDVLQFLTVWLWRDNERKKQNLSIIPAAVKEKWEEFNRELAPKDYSALLQRYVALDIHVEKYSAETGFTKDSTKPIIGDLAMQALENPAILEPEYEWLVTEKAKRGHDFGYALGQADAKFDFLTKLVQAYLKNSARENLNLGLLGGYLHSLNEKDSNSWEIVLDSLAASELMKRFVPALTQASQLTERAAFRIANLFEKNEIAFWELSRFQTGLQIQNLSEKTLHKWLTFLLSQADAYAVQIALNYLYQYYVHNSAEVKKAQLPRELAFKALTHKTLFDAAQSPRFDQMGTFYWKLVADRYLELFPGKSIKLAEILLKRFGQDGCLNRGLDEAPKSVLNVVAKRFPVELWKIAAKLIRFPMRTQTLRIKFWLDDGHLHFGKDINAEHRSVPLEELWLWIDDNIEKRAWFAAWFVPPIITKTEFESPVARELLIRYGNRKDVRNNLYANFANTGVTTGLLSGYYQSRLEEFTDLRKKEDNQQVLEWIDGYIEQLKGDVALNLISEEREL